MPENAVSAEGGYFVVGESVPKWQVQAVPEGV